MKTFKWFILAFSIVTLLSCSTNNAPTLYDDIALDSQTGQQESGN